MCISISSIGNGAPRERGLKRLVGIVRGVVGMFVLVTRVLVQGTFSWLADRFQVDHRI